jgi:hypothetical protein
MPWTVPGRFLNQLVCSRALRANFKALTAFNGMLAYYVLAAVDLEGNRLSVARFLPGSRRRNFRARWNAGCALFSNTGRAGKPFNHSQTA